MRFSIYIGLRVGLSLVNILAISGCMGISVERLQTAEDIQGHSRSSLIETKFWSRTASMQCVQMQLFHMYTSHVVWSLCLCVCVSVCVTVLGTRLSCAETAKQVDVSSAHPKFDLRFRDTSAVL